MRVRVQIVSAAAGKTGRIILPALLALVTLCTVGYAARPAKGLHISSKVLRSMAKMYTAYGNYAKASSLAQSALARAKEDNASDLEMSVCMIELAFLYEKQGRLVEAEQMCRGSLKLQASIYYEGHPYIAQSLRILSSIYKESGKYELSLAAMDKALNIMLQSHLADDKAMAPFYVDYAKLLAVKGDLAQSQAYYLKAQDILETTYAPDHLYMANVKASVARLYTLQGKYGQAQSELNQALAVQQRVYGSNNQLLAPTWLSLAANCQEKQDYSQAERLLSKTLAVVDTKGPNASPLLGRALTGLGQVYITQGKYAKAEGICHRAVTVLENSRGADDVQTAMAFNNLAKLYIHQKKFTQAQDLCDKALSSLERRFDQGHPNVTQVRRTMAQLNPGGTSTAYPMHSQLHVDAINELVALARPN